MKRLSDVDYLVDDNGCWIWQLGLKGKGPLDKRYGQKWDKEKKKQVSAHKWYYEQAKGPVPDGLWLDHLCRVRRCVNPDHLEPVTPQTNILRGDHVQKTHCKNGHLRVEENRRVMKDGTVKCAPCVAMWNEQNKARYHARKTVEV